MAPSSDPVAARAAPPGRPAFAWAAAPLGWATPAATPAGHRCARGGRAFPSCCQEPRPPASSASPWPPAAAATAAAAAAAPAPSVATPPICVAGARTAGRVVLLRHGQTDWNAAGRIQGQLDESRLTDLGVAQAEAARDALAHTPLSALYTSPLTRARATAAVAFSAVPPPAPPSPPTVLPDLAEAAFPWQGGYSAALRHDQGADGDAYRRFRADPEAYVHTDGVRAPLRDVRARAEAAVGVLAAAAVAGGRHDGVAVAAAAGEDGGGGGGGGGGAGAAALPVVAAVGHNQLNRAALSAVLGGGTLAAYTQANASFNVFVVDAGTGAVRLRAANSTRPLGAALSKMRRRPGVVRLAVVVAAATAPTDGGCDQAADTAPGPPPPRSPLPSPSLSPPPPSPAFAAARHLLGASPVTRVVAPTAAVAAAAAAGLAPPVGTTPRVAIAADARLGALCGSATSRPTEAVPVAAAVVADVVAASTATAAAAAAVADGHAPTAGGAGVDGRSGCGGDGVGDGRGSGGEPPPVVLVVAPTTVAAAAVVVAAAGLPVESVTRLALDDSGVSVVDCGGGAAAATPVVQCVNVGVGVGDTTLRREAGDPGPVAPYVAALPGEG